MAYASSRTYLLTKLEYAGLYMRLVPVYSKNIKVNKYLSQIDNVVYQYRIKVMFLFNSKLNNCAEWSKRTGELANKTDNRTVPYKTIVQGGL